MEIMSYLFTLFIGTTTLAAVAEIIFRTTFMYLYTLVNIRIMGKRSIAQMSSFELVIVIALGTAVGDPMMYTNIPLLPGMLVISAIVALEQITERFYDASPWWERLLTGSSKLIIKDGKILKENLAKEHLSIDDLLLFLRLNGVKHVGEVEYAFFERSGHLSVIRYPDSRREGPLTIKIDGSN